MWRPRNTFLGQFGEGFELVRPHLRRVALSPGQVLCEPGERLRTVYFLESGVVSKLTVFEDGDEIECALVGREGAVGVMAALGVTTALTRDICHMQASALAIDSAVLANAARNCEQIHDALDRYCALMMSCAVRNGACSACHPVEQRLCRWLLTCADVLESDEIALPQELFAKMLGVQRTSVNPILRRLSFDGLVEVGRSRVTLLSRGQLQRRACECYGALRRMEADILGRGRPDDDAPPEDRRSSEARRPDIGASPGRAAYR
jgi:CRP-like cAMP-binding protein